MSGIPFKDIIKHSVEGDPITRDIAARAFQIMLNDGATPAQMAALLTAWRMRGETADMLIGAATAMRAKMRRISAPAGTIDTCGTGGDGLHSLNISTAVAIVVAACGVPVAKHGNRAVSSRSGSADVLQQLGVALTMPSDAAQETLGAHKLCFLMAPLYHPQLRFIGPVRQDLGVRTIMNALGPLCNPAGVERQLLGVYSAALLQPMAEALQALGAHKAWVVHGGDGSDELSLTAPTQVIEVTHQSLRAFEVTAAEAGLTPPADGYPPHALSGADKTTNAEALMLLLSGKAGMYRDAVLLNAAAALCVADKCATLAEGAQLAATALDSGRAKETLAALVHASAPYHQEA